MVRAKPAVPLAGEAIVRRIIRWLTGQGIGHVVLNLHHRPETIAAVVGDGTDLGAAVRYSWEQPVILGGAGGPARALPILGTPQFFIVNGDTLCDVSLERLTAAHAASGALVTLALTQNHEPARYGGVHLDDEGRVTGFARRGPEAEGSFHFVGVQLAESRAFEDLSPDRAMASIGGAYDIMIARQPGSVMGFVSDNVTFWDVGTVADYWHTSHAWLAREGPDGWCGASSHIDPQARVTKSIVWDHVLVPRHCVIDECILTDGVRLAEGAQYRRSILIADESGVRAEPLGL
jgi:mannose-1-phosphate guanylyltransferase